jgi:hypothetical protein
MPVCGLDWSRNASSTAPFMIRNERRPLLVQGSSGHRREPMAGYVLIIRDRGAE